MYKLDLSLLETVRSCHSIRLGRCVIDHAITSYLCNTLACLDMYELNGKNAHRPTHRLRFMGRLVSVDELQEL